VNYITSLLTAGKENGEFKKKFDARQTATLFFCAIEGAIMFSRVSASDETMRMVTGVIRRMVAELE
jgi:TetR/AcrR family transcriptional regulator, transcriptional repressor for nem operon